MFNLPPRKFPPVVETSIDGRPVAVLVRVSARARNYRLSIPNSGGPVLTIPRHGRWREAEAFLARQTGWLAARLPHAPTSVVFAHDALVPLRGVPHRIVATGRVRGQVTAAEVEGGEFQLLVPGAPEHRARRLTDWLKRQAEIDLGVRVAVHAAALGVGVESLHMRAQSTRWGSCSSTGRLNFNWRLILAPGFVLDYVAAHEVSHLREMNHSRAFWDTVRQTCPDMEQGRAWLKTHGQQLMAYGV